MGTLVIRRLSVHVLTEKAARDLVERFRAPVYRLAVRMLGDVHEAEDVTQDVLFRLCRTRDTLKPGSDEGAWAYAITLNRCRDILRSHRHRLLELAPTELLDGQDPGASPEQTLDQARRDRQVQMGLQRLPVKYREVLVLRDLEGQPYRRMCEVLGLSESNLKARVMRARRALARSLAELAGEPWP